MASIQAEVLILGILSDLSMTQFLHLRNGSILQDIPHQESVNIK